MSSHAIDEICREKILRQRKRIEQEGVEQK